MLARHLFCLYTVLKNLLVGILFAHKDTTAGSLGIIFSSVCGEEMTSPVMWFQWLHAPVTVTVAALAWDSVPEYGVWNGGREVGSMMERLL